MSALANTDNGGGFPSRDSSALAEALQVDRVALKQRARDPHAELKTRIHRACIARLGSAFLQSRLPFFAFRAVIEPGTSVVM